MPSNRLEAIRRRGTWGSHWARACLRPHAVEMWPTAGELYRAVDTGARPLASTCRHTEVFTPARATSASARGNPGSRMTVGRVHEVRLWTIGVRTFSFRSSCSMRFLVDGRNTSLQEKLMLGFLS